MTYSLAAFSKKIDLSPSRLKDLVSDGRLTLESGKIPDWEAKSLLRDRRTYISLLEYSLLNSSERFCGSKASDRNKLIDFLEDNDFFGLDYKEWSDLRIGIERDMLFFRRRDIAKLDQNCSPFFEYFGFPVKDAVYKLLSKTQEKEATKAALIKYMQYVGTEQELTPSFLDFAKILLDGPDLMELKTQEVLALVRSLESKRAQQYMSDFLMFSRKTANIASVQYGQIKLTNPSRAAAPAYSNSVYLGLAKLIFNSGYIAEHHMIEKAMQSYLYAEMWLYLALHYVLAWRGEDICSAWVYLELFSRDVPFISSRETLAEDILNDRLSSDVYEAAATFCVDAIQARGNLPSKTSAYDPLPLEVAITPELKPFFGLLILIGECHRLHSNKGYMASHRRSHYQNKMRLREFFGPEIWELLKGENISSRRLNKSYLQKVESKAREAGYGGILASAVASYARNHKDLGAIQSYLDDHNLTGETADVVLYCMMERGVMGFEIYQSLLTAYPDILSKLSLKHQNEIMKILSVEPLMIEQKVSGLLASHEIKKSFLSGDNETTARMLGSMLAISQMRGKAKDAGVGCLLRAQGKVCAHPKYDSCLANACPYLVFTRHAIKPLLQILFDYSMSAKHGDLRAKSILRQVLIPRFQALINELINESIINAETKRDLKQLLLISVKECTRNE